MQIKTNLTKMTKYHDNVNLEPIERQVLTFIKSTGIFDSVEYKVTKDNKQYILNDRGRLTLTYDVYDLTLTYDGDAHLQFVADRDSSFFGLKNTIDWKHQGADTTTKFLKMVSEIMAANVEAGKIIGKWTFDDATKEKLEKELNKYFNNKFIRAEYTPFPTNVVPKLHNPYTAGVWSWLSFKLVGTKEPGYKHERNVSVELYNDGSIKNPRIDEFIKKIQCDPNDMQCKPTIKEMQERLANIGKFEEKIKKFNGREIPLLRDFLALQSEGMELRKKINIQRA